MVRPFDAILPRRCAACGAPAHAGLCPGCARTAAALRLPAGGWTRLAPLVGAVGLFAYDGVVKDAVRGMKIGGRHAAAVPLGGLLRSQVGVPGSWTVTWVPSTRRRLRERGADIPRLLAGRDAVALLRRTVDRPDQTSLTAAARRRAPVGVFAARTATPADVVLIDDVRTTGATALAAATALLTGGARRVLVATLAVGGDDARVARQTALPRAAPGGLS